MELRVLGPVEVRARGRELAAGRPQQVAVLAVLAVEAGRLVPMDVLVDRVWDQAPPQRARRSLHTHISRIRRLLERAGDDGDPARLLRRPGGYVLEVDPDRVDLHRFRGLVDKARDAGRADTERVALLREALGLWRGEPLAGLPGEWAQRMRKGWRQQWLEAIVDWSRAERQAGASHLVISRLTDLVEEYPLVEPLAAELMRALHAAGRAAEALSCYAAARQRLVEQLDAILAGMAEEPTAVVVSAVSGTAGVGKTALAIRCQ